MNKNIKLLMTLGVIVICLFFWSISIINKGIRMDENVNAAWSQVLNTYQRRSDLVPNLVAVVKGYATHESETLDAVISARARATQITISPDLLSNPQAMKAFNNAQNELGNTLSRLIAVSENYPDLKANENFLSLQSQLEGTENRIAVARKDFIEAVQEFNSYFRIIPNRWILKTFSDLSYKENFTITEQAQQVPIVDFEK